MSDLNGQQPREIVERALDQLGALAALERALRTAGLRELPAESEALARFLTADLHDELIGLVHPSTASRAISDIRAEIGGVESGLRTRPENAKRTAPPPPSGTTADLYNELASGEVHMRPTPVHGIRAVTERAQLEGAIWILISNDEALKKLTSIAAPRGVDVVVATSVAVLKGGLRRGDRLGSAVVLDAADPSIPIKRTLAALTSDNSNIRVLAWRMPTKLRDRLIGAIPKANTWLPCGPEVTPAEVVKLLGA